jgi:hypothetical protein
LAVASISPGGPFAPKVSALKKTSKKFQKLFFAQSASRTPTRVQNTSLALIEGGGLDNSNSLPPEIHALMANFITDSMYKNPFVSLLSEFIHIVQNGLTELDKALLRYSSSNYKARPLKDRSYPNEKRLVQVKNIEHP